MIDRAPGDVIKALDAKGERSPLSVAEEARKLAERGHRYLTEAEKQKAMHGRPPNIENDQIGDIILEFFESLSDKRATLIVDPYQTPPKPYGPFLNFLTQILRALGSNASPVNTARAAIERKKSGQEPSAGRMVSIRKVKNPDHDAG
ncbi:hypothetical protein [Sphingomicrobium marinum]|uniref:hypothetical protein n=1 Tax=Sphingomicrobium marinum TaxID=1227950 RepID=UPI00223F7502|nr:hypothetical protein [Sphingomicrobium marinum]